MNYISALAVVLGIASGIISIYEFIKKGSWRPGVAYSIAAVILIVAALVVANLPAPSESQVPGNSSTQNPSTSSSGISDTPISTQPPAQNPSPTTVSLPGSGTILCQADSSWSGWNGTSDWHVSNGMLLDDGTDNTPGGSITSPCQLPVADYAVEVTMQVINFQSCCVDNLGIMLRNSSSGGYNVGVEIDSNHLAKISTDYTSLNNLATAHFDPGERVHTYRTEVKGNTIKLFIDGGLLASATDNQYLDAGQVGLYSSFVQVEVTSFKVIAL